MNPLKFGKFLGFSFGAIGLYLLGLAAWRFRVTFCVFAVIICGVLRPAASILFKPQVNRQCDPLKHHPKLHDVDFKYITDSERFATQPEPSSKENPHPTDFGFLNTISRETPCRPPGKLDMENIELLLHAQIVQAEDHILSLREDPRYFAQTLLDMKGHLLLVYPTEKPQPNDFQWARVISFVLFESFYRYEYLTELRNQASHLRELSKEYNPQISLQKDLPEEYRASLLKFQHYIEQSRVIDELSRLLKSQPTAPESLSPYVQMQIVEFCIIGECLELLKRFQPWTNGFENSPVYGEEVIKDEFKEHTKGWTAIIETFTEQNCIALQKLGSPSGTRFLYPTGKSHNRAIFEARRRSKANLDAFWNTVDDMLCRKAGGFSTTAYEQLLLEYGYLPCTPKWAEPAAKKKKEEKSRRTQTQTNNGSCEYTLPYSHPFQKADSALSARAEVLALDSGKTKIKRRGKSVDESTGENVTTSPLPGTPADVHVQPIFKVDARALNVFRTIFFDLEAHTTPGEVAWRDFLHAMRSIGFAAEKLDGSAWHFQPTGLDVERSIQFHEPHPRGKIPFRVARRHGRRLNRAYGWHGGMFVLRNNNNHGIPKM
ncbi:hypothetical protein F5B22DRAFT_662496 [Xylaria bambusicola]|uniref:uncharacterized protein n=1 Tax=Xylaria bambusicola TaxID=326684 RepID=UPI0020084C66|nr:uncharacterized protein F5B22DRAFT_662496 [Xylaria bambusicola]KAI0521391.1 hypothetical protein F5B22DRAFT_662496 [Xylaria bambusicola]